MSQNFKEGTSQTPPPSSLKEGATHTGDAFLDFAYDLLEYTIPKCGFNWVGPPQRKRMSKKVFKESFGDAILLFHKRHAKEFKERWVRFFETTSDCDICNYLEDFCTRTFKGNVPLMEFIAYCAFLVDIGICCFDVEATRELYDVADETCLVFREYIEPYFTTVGGWHALYRVAEQYVRFVTSDPEGLEFSEIIK